MRMTPLDRWAREKTGGLSIVEWQMKKLRETLALARGGAFYREKLPAALPEQPQDIRALPLMDAGDVTREGRRLLCAPPSEIRRIVTLRTSGSTGAAKRMHFTADDLELTTDFFAHGLPTVVEPGGVMAVMMPCKTPYGVGDLICRGLARIPVRAVPWGPLTGFAETAAMLRRERASSVVGVPVQILALIRYLAATGMETPLQSVLLSADHIPAVAARELEARGLRVYKHFGMTETGYGCAIDCDAHTGQHIREPDLLVEIVDPVTDQPVEDGSWGEIVITTLTRRGMPLIRYRTGDRSRIIPGVCPCKSALRRLDDVQGRWRDCLPLRGGALTMPQLDEALFALPQVMDFSAAQDHGRLRLRLHAFAGMPPLTADAVRGVLTAVPALAGTKIVTEIRHCVEYSPLHPAKRLLQHHLFAITE